MAAARRCAPASAAISTGHGHPQNSRLPGASAAYIARQLVELPDGARKGAANMLTFSKAMIDGGDEGRRGILRDAAGHALEPRGRDRHRAEEHFHGTRRVPLAEGGTEPIGERIIELPEDPVRVELRDPKSGFVAYAPPGSLAKGMNLVATGGNKTIACTICHGPTLKGIGDVPGIAASRGDDRAPARSVATASAPAPGCR